VVQGASDGESRLPEPLPPSQEAAELLVAARQLLEAQAGLVELGPAEPGQLLFAIVLPPVQLRTLLVVDDNPDLVGLFRRYLHDQPYRVIQATSGGAALGLSRQLRPGVILLDVLMPSQDGWEILQQLRSHAETRDIPVVICSVLPERALARSLGVHEFLPKPFTRQDLMAVLERSYPTAGGPRAHL
jgi:CheY-like chemotaxis protein